MLAITHTLLSLPIGLYVQEPVVAFVLALLTHLFTDTLLHWNVYLDTHRAPYAWAFVDVASALTLAYILVPDHLFSASMLASLLGGNFPDLWANGVDVLRSLRFIRRRSLPHIGIPRFLARAHEALLNFHGQIQNETTRPSRGLLWQFALGTGSVILLVLDRGQ